MPIIDLNNARILVVDDQASNLMLLDKILRGAKYTDITCVESGEKAIALYTAQPFDAVLLDLNMPGGMDGFEVMAQLQRFEGEDAYAPILVLTAQSDQATKIQALQSGAKDFLGKPFDRTEVLTRVRNLLEVRLLQNQLKDKNILLDEKVRERTKELEYTRLDVIRRLGRASEYKDNETGLHIIRMSRFSQLIGLAAGMGEQEAELLLNASPMHDIGKIGIADHILLKPGKLDPPEWEIMKAHASIGADLLSGEEYPLIQLAAEISLTHHEKWDGSGYPRGLKGEEIPLVGRIVAIADVFDALTSERPYKKAWSVEDAVAFIREQSGLHFEPRLVECFLSILPQILEVRNAYVEPEYIAET
jgi:putative two-component system response regulator